MLSVYVRTIKDKQNPLTRHIKRFAVPRFQSNDLRSRAVHVDGPAYPAGSVLRPNGIVTVA